MVSQIGWHSINRYSADAYSRARLIKKARDGELRAKC